MKIEIDIDIESIVREALKKQQSEDTIPVQTMSNVSTGPCSILVRAFFSN